MTELPEYQMISFIRKNVEPEVLLLYTSLMYQSKGKLQKKGLGVEDRMNFSKKKLEIPLLISTVARDLGKLAFECWNNLLYYMGLHEKAGRYPTYIIYHVGIKSKSFVGTKSHLPISELTAVQRIINMCIGHETLRNEFYLQLIKQLTGNF